MTLNKPSLRVRYVGHELLVSERQHQNLGFARQQVGIHEAQVLDGSLPGKTIFLIFDRETQRVLDVPGKGSFIHARMQLEWIDGEIDARMRETGDCLAEEEDEWAARRQQCAAEVLEKLYPLKATKVVIELSPKWWLSSGQDQDQQGDQNSPQKP